MNTGRVWGVCVWGRGGLQGLVQACFNMFMLKFLSVTMDCKARLMEDGMENVSQG